MQEVVPLAGVAPRLSEVFDLHGARRFEKGPRFRRFESERRARDEAEVNHEMREKIERIGQAQKTAQRGAVLRGETRALQFDGGDLQIGEEGGGVIRGKIK